MGCDKEKNAPGGNYEWSATINGVSYNYSMPSYPSNDGGNVMYQIANTGQGTSTSTLQLLDEGSYPAIQAGYFPTVPGTYVFNSQNVNPQNLTGFSVLLSSNISNPQSYSTIVPNAQVTLNITSVGNVGGLVEGNFSGTVGKQSTTPPYSISYINVSGNFKAYRER